MNKTDEQIEKLKNHLEKIDNLMAFCLYKEYDIEQVKRMYPNCIDFVLKNKDKTITEAKHEMFPRKRN